MRRACLLCDKSELEVKTACLILLDNKLVAEHWNTKKESVGHAEFEALKSAIEKVSPLNGATIYVTRFPCTDCAKILIHYGIKQIFYMSDHFVSNNASLPLLSAANIEVVQISEKVVWSK